MFSLIALIYWVITAAFSLLMKRTENRFSLKAQMGRMAI
jgi:ABC-type amino acid transport system permease subunit